MIRFILCCSCFGMEKRAKKAFEIIKPDEWEPPVVKGRDRIYKLARELDNDHILAISKLSGRFAYCVGIEKGEIVEEYNLMTGARIA